MKKKRIVVTGIGPVSPIGCGIGSFVDSLKQGRTGIRKPKRIDTHGPGKFCAEVIDYEPEKLFDSRKIRRIDRFSLMALGATKYAISDAGINRCEYRDEDIGLILSTHYGPSTTVYAYMENMIRFQEMSPALFSQTVMNVPLGYISIEFKLKGISSLIQGGDGFLFGYEHIRSGDAPVILLGGVDELTQNVFDSYDILGFTTDVKEHEKISYFPPEKEKGFFLGEGACILVLEEYEQAVNNRRDIYGEIIGVGGANDTTNDQMITEKTDKGNGIKLAIERAIESACIKKEEIDCIFSCGNGSTEVEDAELRALQNVFGKGLKDKAIITGKSYYGECFHAACFLNTALALLCLKENDLWLHLEVKNYLAEPVTAQNGVTCVLCNNIYNNGGNSSVILRKIR